MTAPDAPGPHPEPDVGWLHAQRLPLVSAAGAWFRVHPLVHDPVYFGRSGGNRFDDPLGEYGVLYLGGERPGCFVEVFGNVEERNAVTLDQLGRRGLARINLGQARVLDLTGDGLSRIRADGRLTTGGHGVSQRWSRALWSHPDQPDGMLFRARRDPERISLALFDRAGRLVQTRELLGALTAEVNVPWVEDALNRYGFAILPSGEGVTRRGDAAAAPTRWRAGAAPTRRGLRTRASRAGRGTASAPTRTPPGRSFRRSRRPGTTTCS